MKFPLSNAAIRSLRTCGKAAAAVAALALWGGSAHAANPNSGLRVQIMTGYNYIVDSNAETPATYAPSAAVVSAQFCNDGATAMTGVTAYIGSYQRRWSAIEPGVMPAIDSDEALGGGDTDGDGWTKPAGWAPNTQLTGTGDYALKLETGRAGVSDATRPLGTIPAGECRTQYWLVSYPQCVNVSKQPDYPPCTTSIAKDIIPDNDLKLEYDIWAVQANGATSLATRSATMRNEISAMANKILPQTDNQVPEAYKAAIGAQQGWDTLGPDGASLNDPVYPGQRVVTTQGIWYYLGNVGQGFDNNGDGVPDQNAWLQPIGDPAGFDAGCVRLVNTYGLLIITRKDGSIELRGFRNQLYFEGLPDNTSVVGLVYYQFVATNGACTVALSPYQEAASGFDNEKFNGDFGAGIPPIQVEKLPAQEATIVKTGSPAGPIALASTINYTITATAKACESTIGSNPDGNCDDSGDYKIDLGAPEFGTPMAIVEEIPAGTEYDGDTATVTANNTLTNTYGRVAGGGTSYAYTVYFSSDNQKTWTSTDPCAGQNPGGATVCPVTHIRWVLDTDVTDSAKNTSLPWGESATVKFSLYVPSGYAYPFVENWAGLAVAFEPPFIRDDWVTFINGTYTLGGTVFNDDAGGGGTAGDGIDDATGETGIPNITVSLYYDRPVRVIDGRLDVNRDGVVNNDDDGTFFGYPVYNGYVDFDKDGVVYNGVTYDTGDTSTSFGIQGLNVTTYRLVNLVNGLLDLDNDTTTNGDTGDVGYAWDGILDGNDPAWSTPTANTNASGDYSFSSLTNGTWIVKVDVNDGDLPTGAGPTTDVVKVVGYSAKDTPSINTVDFGFLTPLTIDKFVTNGVTTYYEGDTVNYTINLKNRLPTDGNSAGDSCVYYAWPTKKGTSVGGNFTVADNTGAVGITGRDGVFAVGQWAPNTGENYRVEGFNLGAKPGDIIKVEAVFGGYVSGANQDGMRMEVWYGGTQYTETAGTPIVNCDATVPYPATCGFLDNDKINNLISPESAGLAAVEVTPSRAWNWSDFSSPNLALEVSLEKISNPQAYEAYVDALGYRITTNVPCATNEMKVLNPVPLTDTFESAEMAFVSAVPTPDSTSPTGTLTWNNVGPINPGETKTVTVTMKATAPHTTSLPNTSSEDTATSTGSKFADGRNANSPVSDTENITIAATGEISGVVWADANNNGWQGTVGYDTFGSLDYPIAGAKVWLYMCTKTTVSNSIPYNDPAVNKTCTQQTNGQWTLIATTYTDANGAYMFSGLRYDDVSTVSPGYYMVHVDYTSFSTAQPTPTADADQTATGLCGTPGSGDCDETTTPDSANIERNKTIGLGTATASNTTAGAWTRGAVLRITSAAEHLQNISFGYNFAGKLAGTIWRDYDSDGIRDTGDDPISGGSITVSLYNRVGGVCGGGDETTTGISPATVSSTTGDYLFEGLSAGTYCVRVGTGQNAIAADYRQGTGNSFTLPTVSSSTDWKITDEGNSITGVGDATVDNWLEVTISTGEIEARKDFGFHISGAYSLGDALYYDFNGDGTKQAGEEMMSGVEMQLYLDRDYDSMIDPTDNYLGSVNTTSSGYTFSSLLANTGSERYLVIVNTADPDFPTNQSPAITVKQTQDPSDGETTPCTTCDSRANKAISTASIDTLDFGYRPFGAGQIGDWVWYDRDGDGVQDGGAETGISGVTVELYWDANKDGTFPTSPTATTVTSNGATDVNGDGAIDPAGTYWFQNLPDGAYRVVVRDSGGVPRSGSYYKQTNTAATRDAGNTYSYFNVTLSGSNVIDNDNDFGYVGNPAIGDTVFWDLNRNGQQDTNETGINGVVLTLYSFIDGNGDGVFDPDSAGDTLGSAITTATTATQNGIPGMYLFPDRAPGLYVVAVTTPPSGATLTSDPDADGLTFDNATLKQTYTNATDCDTVPNTAEGACDARVGRELAYGQSFMGADFGYYGVTGFIGDRVFMDVDADGIQDAGEQGIAGVQVWLCSTTPCGSGNASQTKVTDSDGMYTFTGVGTNSGNPWYVQVNTNTADANYPFPAGLTNVDEVDNGTLNAGNSEISVVLSLVGGNAQVTSINGQTTVGGVDCSVAGATCFNKVDFGYDYTGNNTVSGEVCLQPDTDANNWCGTTINVNGGVTASEGAFGNVVVSMYRWNDSNTNSVIDALEQTDLIATTTTNAAGLFQFTSVPDGDVILVISAPQTGLYIQTTAADTYADYLTSTSDTLSALSPDPTLTVRQGIKSVQTDKGAGAGSVPGIDFAFEQAYSYDFGDGPTNYTVTVAQGGPGHGQPASGYTVWLGSSATPNTDVEEDAKSPGTAATGDDLAGTSDEDGVTYGAFTLNSATFTVGGGAGYVTGWVDRNNDGQFGSGELVVSQTYDTTGTKTVSFMPGEIANTVRDTIFSRFRIFKEAPPIPELASTGLVMDGEVEDHQLPLYWDYGDLPATLPGTSTNTSYGTTFTDGGARHYVPPGAPTLYIGTTTENGSAQEKVGGFYDGISESAASNDRFENGIASTASSMKVNTKSLTASLSVTSVTNSTGRDAQLVAWADFNCDGDFNDSGERSLPYLNTSQDNSFTTGNIPTGTSTDLTLFFSGFAWTRPGTCGNLVNTRIRLTTHGNTGVAATKFGFFSDQSPTPGGGVADGEVEDWQMNPTPTYALIDMVRGLWDDQQSKALVVWKTITEVGTVGFHVEVKDPATGGWTRLNSSLLPGMLSAPNGARYSYVDAGARLGDKRTYRLVEIDSQGQETVYGPYTVKVRHAMSYELPRGFVAPQDRGIGADIAGFVRDRFSPTKADHQRLADARAERLATKAARVPPGKAPALKIRVKETGVYFIGVAEMVTKFGLTEKEVRQRLGRGGFRLSHRGEEVAYWISGDGLSFYGQSFRDTYTDQNVYWLTRENGTLAGTVAGRPSGTAGDQPYFMSTVVAEKDLTYSYSSDDPRADLFMWSMAVAGGSAATYPVTLPDLKVGAAGEARVRVWLRSLLTVKPGIGEHRVQVTVNNASAGPEMQWDGIHHVVFEGRVPAGALLASGNVVKVLALRVAGVSVNYIGVDRIEIDYPRYYRARADQLAADNMGYSTMSVTGLSGNAVQVVDVTNPRRPALVRDVAVTTGTAGYLATFATSSPDAKYFVVGPAGRMAPLSVEGDVATSWKKPNHSVDYLVIAPEVLEEGAKALAQYRSAEYRTDVALLEDIYDEFNGGMPDAEAIKAFLAYAYENWAQRPTYVVLMGRGTYDHRDVLGKGNLLPTLLTATPYGLFNCDGCYGNVSGDATPEFRIGRISVLANSEALAYVEKVKAYEAADPTDWGNTLLFLSDDADKAGDFAQEAGAASAEVRPPFVAERIAHGLKPYVGGATRTALLSRLQQGVGMLNYTGHASPFSLGSEQFLQRKDIPPLDVSGEKESDWLRNGERAPIFVGLTCMVGNTGFPELPSISELMLNYRDGGAIAAFVPTAPSLSSDAAIINQAFVRAAYGDQPVSTVGEGVTQGIGAVAAGGMADYMARIYSLLGDPALKLH